MTENQKNIIQSNLQKMYYRVLAILKEKGIDIADGEIPIPTISYDLKGTKAGIAMFPDYVIKLNIDILSNPDNFKEMSEFVLYHELAHIFVMHLNYFRYLSKPNILGNGTSKKVKSHGEEWKKMMELMGQPPKRTHNFKTKPMKTYKKITYFCSCREHELTKILHNRIIKGQTRKCRICKDIIKPKT